MKSLKVVAIPRRLHAIPVLGWMVLIALLLRLAAIPFNNFQNLMDTANLHTWEQGNVARALVSGHGFGSPFGSAQPSAIMPPVYPLVVAALFRCFGTHTAKSIVTVHVFDCLVNALACIPLFLLARRSFGPRVAMATGWLWVLSPYGIYFSAAWAWSTHLLLLSLYVLLYLAHGLEQSPRLRIWLRFGFLAGFAGLIEPSVLVVSAFLIALAAWNLAQTGRRWLLPGLVACLALAAVISPWMIRNAIVFHRFIPMRDSIGLELWMGNNGYSTRWTSDHLHPLHDPTELAAYNHGELAYMDAKSRAAKTYIHNHPAWYARMCARRALYLWTGYWSFDKEYLAMEPTDPENVPFATCLTLLALLGLHLAWQRHRLDAIRYAGVLFLFPAVYYFTHPEPYHMRPLDPLIVLLGCYAILTLRGRRKEAIPTVAPLQHAAA